MSCYCPSETGSQVAAKDGADTPPPAVTWSDLPGTDGQRHALADLAEAEAVVVAITCNHCPIALEYFPRINEFVLRQETHGGRVAVVAISVSDLITDKLPRMKELAERHKFKFAYLYDESQGVAKVLQATYTPQFFVLNKTRQVVYQGGWDNNVNPAKATEHYVDEAVKAVLAGRSPSISETKGRGCIISYR